MMMDSNQLLLVGIKEETDDAALVRVAAGLADSVNAELAENVPANLGDG